MSRYYLLLTAFILFFAACTEDRKMETARQRYYESSRRPTDSIMAAVFRSNDYERALALVDSFERRGEMTPVRADYYRANAYDNLGDLARAKAYFHRVIEAGEPEIGDSWVYERSGYRFGRMLYDETQYEGALRVAMPVIAYLDSLGFGQMYAKTGLITLMGCSQLNLGQHVQAGESFDRLEEQLESWLETDKSGQAVLSAIEFGIWICGEYINAGLFDEAKTWSDRTQSFIPDFIVRFGERAPENTASVCASVDMLRIRVEQGLGHAAAAARAYDRYRATPYAATDEGKMEAVDYLMSAGRYAEAADCFAVLDTYTRDNEIELSVDWLGEAYIPKLRANLLADRKDSALFVAGQVVAAYDSALVRQKRSVTTELATLFDMQGKERQIEKQRSQLLRQRLWGIAIALVLLVVFFIFYDLHRRRAHRQLQEAYDQLEETTAAKERIESELRIARDIQLSMVPTVFPVLEGLDFSAAMNPAKEVGGDLYDFVLQGDRLHFCVGDVSGKGVPASLFMSQSTRLFHTFASEGMMPADIATRMNNELVQNNEKCMFVTMFIGMLDLSTGRLDFCNCGHNPPVLGGQFLEMAYTNSILGIFPGMAFQGETIADFRSCRLLVYTDGLNEAENREHRQFGNDSLLAMMEGMAALSAREVIAGITKTVEDFRDGAEPNDDLTLLYLKM